MKAYIKHLISLVIFISASAVVAAPAAGDHADDSTAHHDWNKVFPQPTPNLSKSTPPAASKILAPNFHEKIKGSEVTLKWEAVPNALYHLQVATDPNYKWLVVNQALISTTEHNLKELKANQQYFWRVYTQIPDNMPSHTKGPAVTSAFQTAE